MFTWSLILALGWSSLSYAMEQVAELEPPTEGRPRCGWILDKRIPRRFPQEVGLKLGTPEGMRGIISPGIRTFIESHMVAERKNFLLPCLSVANAEGTEVDIYIHHLEFPIICQDLQQTDDVSIFAWQDRIKNAVAALEQRCKCNFIAINLSHNLSELYARERIIDIKRYLRAYHGCFWGNIERKITSPVVEWHSRSAAELFDQEEDGQKIRLINQICGQEGRRMRKAVKYHYMMMNKIKRGWCPWLRLMDLVDVDDVIFAYLSPLDAQLLYQMTGAVVLDDEEPQ